MCGEGGSNLELYRASLEEEGHQVQVLESRDEARLAVQTEGFDLVILDLEAAGPEALDLVRELKTAGAPEVTAVLKQAPSPDQALALRDAGVYEFLERPFSMTKLAVSVENALAKGSMERDLAAGPGGQPSSPPPPAAGDAGRVLALERELEELRRRASQSELDRARLDGLQTRVETLKALVRRKDQEITLLRADLKGLQDSQKGAREGYEQAIEGHRKARESAEQEVSRLLTEIEERAKRHARQLELLSSDDKAIEAGYENRVGAMSRELSELKERYQAVVHERENLTKQLAEGRTAGPAKESVEKQIAELTRTRDDLQRRLDAEVRKHENEVRVLVRERKKLVEESHRVQQELSKALEDERAARKQMQLEYEGLRADLPQERRKVHALVEYQRSLTENVLAGILTVDTSGIITLGNELAAKFLETKLSVLLGAHVDQCEPFASLRPLFAAALAEGHSGTVDFEIRPGVNLRAKATKVPFGPRELVLFSVIGPDRVEVAARDGTVDVDSGPLARLGAAVAGNITDVQDFAVEIRSYLERLYGTTGPDSPSRDEVNGALRKVGELIDFLRDIIEQAESYLS